MSQKVVYVTGAGRGIGQSVSVKLAKAGFKVFGCARTSNELKETQNLAGAGFSFELVDVCSEEQQRAWFKNGEKLGTPWGLVTAAGVYGPIGPFVKNNWSEWAKALEINLFGTALSVQIFSQRLIELKKPGRIMLLSGGGATQPLPNFSSYCAAKSAVVRFGETVAHELKPHGITVTSCAPGAVNTRLTDELLKAGPGLAGEDMYSKAIKQKESGGTSPEKAADLALYLMGEDSSQVTAKLISAVWDPWSTLHEKWSALEKSDIYTLKRITPEDRPKVELK